MFVEELPTFRVKMGRSGEKLAVQVSEKIRRPDVVKTDLAFLGKDIIAELDNDEDEDEETVE
jgi:flagellar motor switch protein FliM